MKKIWKGLLILLAVVFIYGMFFDKGSSTPSVAEGKSESATSTPVKSDYSPDKIDLHIQAQQFVLQGLKSPSTAKFPALPYEAVSLGDGAYRVSSYVDSQNSFGAMIRSDWQVKMFLVEKHWFLDRMVVDGKVVYDASINN